ncbi:MAG: hypothetical protein HRU17_02350 [Polyangiaceae bacterium]|nr:hypothetical protein [Polyangiaceae bacterium]
MIKGAGAFCALALVATACSDDTTGDGSDGNGGTGASNGTGASGSTAGSSGTGASNGTGGTSSNGTGGFFGGFFDGGTGDDDSGMEVCASNAQDVEATQAHLMFLVDRSGSMNCMLPERWDELTGFPDINSAADEIAVCETNPANRLAGSESKWVVTTDALKSALADLTSESNISAGLTFFPATDLPDDNFVDDCAVTGTPDIALQTLNTALVTNMSTTLEGVSPAGATPLAGATIEALAKLVGQGLDGKPFLVLMTDGNESCDGTWEVPGSQTQVQKDTVEYALNMFNIRTFVIGAPGSETARALLSELAYLGGTATTADCAYGGGDPAVGDCHFDLTSSGGGADAGADGGAGTDFAAELADALKAIAAQAVVTCQYDVPTGGRVDRSGVIIKLEANDPSASVTFEPADGDCDNGANGWMYSEDGNQILLCGAACDTAESVPGRITIDIACDSRTQ